MDNEPPPQSDVEEFLESLSQSGALGEIRVVVSAIEHELRLEVTYQFVDREACDGKPLALGFTATPALLQGIDVAGCRAFDPEADDDAVSRSSLAILVEAQEGAGWTGATLTTRLSWPSPDADASERFLRIPEQLPLVITGIRDGSQPVTLPRVSLQLDASAKDRFAAGAAAGSRWPDEDGPMDVLHAVLTRPGFDIVSPPTPESSAETLHAVAWTVNAIASSNDEQRALFARFVHSLLLGMEHAFGVPITTRSLIVSDVEAPRFWGLGISNILVFQKPSDDAPPGSTYFAETAPLVLRLSRIWWGSGVRVSGPRRDVLELAIGNSMALRVRQMQNDKPIDPEPMLSRMRLRSDPLAVRAMTFGASIFLALRSDVWKKEAFRELTRSSWQTSMPDLDFIDWCAQQGIQAPADIAVSE